MKKLFATPSILRFSVSEEELEYLRGRLGPILNDGPGEVASYGHVLVELVGTSRRWVATDAAGLVAVTTTGQCPRDENDDDVEETARFLLSPRFLATSSGDWVIELNDDGKVFGRHTRAVTLERDGIRYTLPEHPEEFPETDRFIHTARSSRGARASVDPELIRQLLALALHHPTPIAREIPDHPHIIHLELQPSRLSVRTCWQGLPDTLIESTVENVEGSATCSFDALKLHRTLNAVVPWLEGEGGPGLGTGWGDDMDTCDLVLPDSPEGPLLVQCAERLALLMPLQPASGLPTTGEPTMGWPQQGQ